MLYSPPVNVWKPIEWGLVAGAKVTWPAFQAINRRVKTKAFHPKWSPAPLPKSHERTKPQLGFPRTTDSLCPVCVRETRARILSGQQPIQTLLHDTNGEIKADILERDGKIIVEKTCPTHGTFVDTLSINPAFLHRLETLGYPLVLDTVQINSEPTKPGMVKMTLTIIILDFEQFKIEEVPSA
jgi:hypothetical protein